MRKKFDIKAIGLKARGILKWFYPGIGIKRWISFSTFGVILIIIGSLRLQIEQLWIVQALNVIVLISGIIILILGIMRMMRFFMREFGPSEKNLELVDILYQKRQLARGPKVVTVGGGPVYR
ncbi:MAG: hypothetical protein ABIA66_00345 [Candidatus Omnitrophota bacterium]